MDSLLQQVIAAARLWVVLIICSLASHSAVAQDNNKLPIEGIRSFVAVFETIKNQYAGQITDDTLFEYAIDGMLSRLDKYSGIVYADSYPIELSEIIDGDVPQLYSAPMVLLKNPENEWTVQSITNTYRKLLPEGSTITHIDGQPLQAMEADEVRKLLLGAKGSQITVQANLATGQAQMLKVKRTVLEQLRVHSFMLPDGVLYIHIPAFYAQLSSDLLALISRQGQSVDKPITGLVVDVRGNIGGLLSVAGEALGMFLPLGSVYAIQNLRTQGDNNAQQLTTLQVPNYPDLPMAVIVDQTSASAAEVFAMALQERERALVVGQPTRGKTSIQKVFNLNNTQSYTLTVGEYLSARGTSINKVGLTPQLMLEFTARPPHNNTLPEMYRFAAAQDPWVLQAQQQLVKLITGR